jgi:hypothetical protein
MNTAKELAYKAFVANIIVDESQLVPAFKQKLTDMFELWWDKYYGNKEQPEFNPETSVFIGGQRYIQAE